MMDPVKMPIRVRMLLIALGLSVLFWLPVEDVSTASATFLGLMGAVAMGLRVFPAIQSNRLRTFAVWGLACGLAVTPLTAALMVFKTGLHGHGGVPDFTAADFLDVITRTPVFAGAGILIGAGLYYLTDLTSHADR